MSKSLTVIIIIIIIAIIGWLIVSQKGNVEENREVSNTALDNVDKEGVAKEASINWKSSTYFQFKPRELTSTSKSSSLQPPTGEEIQNLKETSIILKTNMGDIIIQLLPQKSPVAVANFLNLTRAHFYDGVKFHRVIPDFMIQTGDPNSKDDNWSDDGTGGPGYTFADEVAGEDQLVKGTVAMANSGPNTNGSQFFIVTAASTPWLNGKHTIFGQVIKGMDVVDAISQVQRNNQDHPLQDIVIEDVVLK